MKKTTGLKILAAVLLIVLLVEIFVLLPMAERRNEPAAETTLPLQTEPVSTTQETVRETTTAPTETAAPAQTTAPTVQPTVTTEPDEPEYIPPETQAPPVAPPPTEAPEAFALPCTDAESGLRIEEVKSYDGKFLEDGSDTEVAGVAAVIVRNTGSRCVDYARVLLTGSSTVYTFEVTGMEAGATMVVLEAGKAPYVHQAYDAATVEAAHSDGFERSEQAVGIRENGRRKLEVTNLTQEEIPCIRIFYKFYQSEKDVYLGGITYTAKITGLKAGETVTVKPSHYMSGQSRVIMVKTYETDAE